MEVARAWSSAGATDDRRAEDLKAFGVAPPPSVPEAPVEVLPENADAVRVFFACATQWRVSDGALLGLDYAGVRAAADMMDVEQTPELFDRLRVLESETLRVSAERRKNAE